MEKPSKINRMLSFLPKSAAISFSSQPFSPGRDKHRSHASKKGFSGSVISIVPVEARTKKARNGSFHGAQEPSSPKISCMGQIKKHKRKTCKAKLEKKEAKKGKKKTSKQRSNGGSILIRWLRGGKVKEEVLNGHDHAYVEDYKVMAPSLGQLRKFSSGREAFSDFDYQFGAAKVMGRHRGYYSDEEKGESDEEDEFLVPYSAPLGGGGVGKLTALEPKKEINIWKRRTMAPPRALQI